MSAAYLTLAADPYPGFTGRPGSYPIEVEIPEPGPQNRWVTGFRLLLAFPALLLADTLVGFGSTAAGGGYLVGRRGLDRRLPGLVLLPRTRPHGGGAAQRLRVRDRVHGAGLRLPVLLHQRYPNSDPATYEFANVYRADPSG